MHNIQKNNIKNLLIRSFLALLLSILTYTSLSRPISGDIDPSWIFAQNYLYTHNLMAVKAFFSYGPFGFLLYPEPIGNNLLIGNGFIFLTRFILIITFLELISFLHKDKKPLYQLLILGFLVLFITIRKTPLASFDYLQLFFITVNLLLLFNCKPSKPIYLYLAVLVTTINFLISPGYSLYACAALYSYLVIFCFKYKNYRLFFTLILSQIICYLALWLIFVNHALVGSLNYLITSYQIIIGNSDAMSLNPPNNWFYISSMLIFAFSGLVVFNRKNILAKDGVIIPMIFILPIYAAFKYAYGREAHTFFMLFFLIWTFLYWSIAANGYKKIWQLILLGGISITFMLLSRAYLQIPLDMIYKNHPNLYVRLTLSFDRILDFKGDFLNYAEHKKSLSDISASLLREEQLPKNWLNIINQQTVDIYPCELSVIAANNLNWQPRPIIQEYVSFTTYLDHLNAVHFNNKLTAPKYLIWYENKNFYHWYFPPAFLTLLTPNTTPNTEKPIAPWLLSADFKYSLSTEPETIYQILKWYKLILAHYPTAYLLERQDQPLLSEPITLNTETTNWNTWITVPKTSNGIIRAKLTAKETFLLKIKRLIYKLDDVWIDYKFTDGSIITNRLVLATAAEGIWVSPYKKYIYEITPYFHAEKSRFNKKVIAIRIYHGKYDLFKDNITITWEHIKWLRPH